MRGSRHRRCNPILLSQAFEQARLGRLDEAEKLLEYVLAANADSTPANHLMGAIRLHQDRVEDALPFVKRAAASSAATAEMHCILGAVLYKLGNTHEAIDAYERSLAVKPGHTDALDALANIYREEQKSMRAGGRPAAGGDQARAASRQGRWETGLSRRGAGLALRDDGRQQAQRGL